jgi:hypothetical protein
MTRAEFEERARKGKQFQALFESPAWKETMGEWLTLETSPEKNDTISTEFFSRDELARRYDELQGRKEVLMSLADQMKRWMMDAQLDYSVVEEQGEPTQ